MYNPQVHPDVGNMAYNIWTRWRQDAPKATTWDSSWRERRNDRLRKPGNNRPSNSNNRMMNLSRRQRPQTTPLHNFSKCWESKKDSRKWLGCSNISVRSLWYVLVFSNTSLNSCCDIAYLFSQLDAQAFAAQCMSDGIANAAADIRGVLRFRLLPTSIEHILSSFLSTSHVFLSDQQSVASKLGHDARPQ